MLYSLIKKLTALAGDEAQASLVKHLHKRELFRSLKLLASRGVSIEVVYDIGAHKGSWAKELRSEFPDVKITMFEAVDGNRPYLEAAGFPFFIGVLAAKAGPIQFFSIGSTGDSIFHERTRAFADVKSVEVDAKRLDDVISEENLAPPALIKIDTQGAELEILKGGQKALASAKMVYSETPILNYNQGAPNIQEYLDFFAEFGFLPHKICELHSDTGVLLQVDILFVKKDVLVSVFPSIVRDLDGYLV